MLACAKGKPEVVKVLLDYGADVAKTQSGAEKLNSLELAIENGRRCVLYQRLCILCGS